MYKFSASQIDTYRSCARKWAWDRIAKVPRQTHPSAALGSRCHSQWERYLTTGETPLHALDDGTLDVTGAICEPSLPELPAPMSPTLEVEQYFNFASPRTGYIYNGFVDFRMRLPDRGDEKWALVGDHKSTGNLAYAKTPTDLLTDPQAVLYAFHTMAHFEVPNVRLQWNYASTKRPYRHLQVIQEVHSPGVAAEFEGLEITAAEMATLLDTCDETAILDLPPNLDTCSAYGGCPYKHKCAFSPMESMRTLMSEDDTMSNAPVMMSALDRMRALRAGTTTIAPSPVAAAIASFAAKLPGVVVTKFGPAVQEDLPPAAVADPPPIPVAPGQINPPESSAPPTAEQLHTAQEAEKVKRTRRTKAEMEAARAVQGTAVITEKAVEVVPAEAQIPSQILPVLFIDCIPVKGAPFADASGLIAAANAKVCEIMKVGDYRYVDYKGSAMLAEAAVALLKASAGGTPIYLSSDTPEGKALIAPLSVLASVIVKGVR